MKEISYDLRIKLFVGEEKCFGPGIASLLRGVQQHKSLSAAGRELNMSYSKAWTIIKKCEKAMDTKLLEMHTGGSKGGGADLTPQALDLLSKYDTFCSKINSFADEVFEECFK